MKNKGFTLIELLVVIAIIGVLATIVLSSLSQARMRARDANRVTLVKQIQNALELYNLDNGNYPIAAGNASTCPSNNFGSASWSQFTTDLAPYMDIPATDLSGNTYGYSGVGQCYSYNTNSGSSGICGGNTFASGQGYCLYWANEITRISPYFNTEIGVGSLIPVYQYHRVQQPK